MGGNLDRAAGIGLARIVRARESAPQYPFPYQQIQHSLAETIEILAVRQFGKQAQPKKTTRAQCDNNLSHDFGFHPFPLADETRRLLQGCSLGSGQLAFIDDQGKIKLRG